MRLTRVIANEEDIKKLRPFRRIFGHLDCLYCPKCGAQMMSWSRIFPQLQCPQCGQVGKWSAENIFADQRYEEKRKQRRHKKVMKV